MTLVVDIFRKLIPPRTKTSPSGWTSFNAPCCGHRGHKPDNRKRGGLRFDHGIVYNCFNCKFTASWKPGRPLTEKFKNLCRWMGASDDDIRDMIFEALKTESEEYQHEDSDELIQFSKKELPEATRTIKAWLNDRELADVVASEISPVVQYLVDRGCDPLDDNFCWSPSDGFNDRVIIPFKYQGAVVGFTARKVVDGKPKYISDQHHHFVFNVDAQKEESKYVFVCEGPFDALSVGGVALLTNEIADQQSRIINSLGKEVIVIPDQDLAGTVLIKQCIENGWSVAFPNWDSGVKDAAEAVQKYGKLFVIVDAIKTAQSGAIKINMALKHLENKIKIEQEREGI